MRIAISILAVALVGIGLYAETHVHDDQPKRDADDWSELIACMNRMHMAMGAIERSGDVDVDFVRLMVPHHQGAIDMAKVQLLHGKDPQMRRLAQEIITDQQLEIELMQRWLEAHASAKSKQNGNSAGTPKEEN